MVVCRGTEWVQASVPHLLLLLPSHSPHCRYPLLSAHCSLPQVMCAGSPSFPLSSHPPDSSIAHRKHALLSAPRSLPQVMHAGSPSLPLSSHPPDDRTSHREHPIPSAPAALTQAMDTVQDEAVRKMVVRRGTTWNQASVHHPLLLLIVSCLPLVPCPRPWLLFRL